MKRRRTGTVIPAGYGHEGKVFVCSDNGSCQCRGGARAPARAIHNRLCAGSNGNAGTEEGLHTRCLSSLRRRNPERAGHHLLPAAAEGEPERSVPGGVRAVRSFRAIGGWKPECVCARHVKGAEQAFAICQRHFVRDILAPRAGFEPATIRLTVECSTAELPRNRRNRRGSRRASV